MSNDPQLVEASDPFTFKLRIDTTDAEAAMDRLREKAEAALAAILSVMEGAGKAAGEALMATDSPSEFPAMYAEAMTRMT